MKLYVSERRIKPFSMYLVTIGSILILISLIAGISMQIARMVSDIIRLATAPVPVQPIPETPPEQ